MSNRGCNAQWFNQNVEISPIRDTGRIIFMHAPEEMENRGKETDKKRRDGEGGWRA